MQSLNVLGILAGVMAFWIVGPAHAEVYRWTDDAGTVHFTEDGARVPQRYRRQTWGGELNSKSVATDLVSTGALRPQSLSPSASRRPQSPGVVAVGYSTEDNLIKVFVKLNGRVRVPFYVDTGSSELVLPRSTARKLGVDLSATGATATLLTAMGRVEVPALRLESVRLGDAEVEDVWATVSPSLEVGLLGGAFLNRFVYSIDPVTQTITLTPRGSRTELR